MGREVARVLKTQNLDFISSVMMFVGLLFPVISWEALNSYRLK